ncbi:DUF5060 domain-containing protein [Opitutus terrae]|uniref:DUF5060 domain-containing protein n=1 Tax=Opitutus terrae (strain DSM 11246 / JCM 15787 / PB90-1) TaxID=452637 RepID=B1ZX11_OPITP|nr:DUF5060 domain-containing protein [Opitutus terrae]ACB75122.1 conserved hypothetical protein-signal peptide and transmembrane prediction [Opitutus terrae PB90-1]
MRIRHSSICALASAAIYAVFTPAAAGAAALVAGKLEQWHKITLSIDGPEARETDTSPNPFLDYRMDVTFTHESGAPSYRVPGYFAVDGNAAETSAFAGRIWRAHLAPDKPGMWRYAVSFRRGPEVAVSTLEAGAPVDGCDGISGEFTVVPTDKTGRDFRAHGRLDYVGGRYLRFAGSGEYFLKVGADSPENLLGYSDFDGTRSNKPGTPARPDEAAPPSLLKTWQPHVRDWREGDPTWQHRKGKGLIGALNYLASTGCNAFSFLTYNAGGDGDDVWPFVERDDPLHFDCSKLDQWQIIFDHATALGLHLHFKLEETENDDNRPGGDGQIGDVPTALDRGKTGVERKLYLRELIARFAHELALNWNLGEENTLSTEQQQAMAAFIRDTDPYHHPIVLHTFPDWQERVYRPLLGDRSALTGVSLQTGWEQSHRRVLQWIEESAAAGKQWVVAHDEQNPHYTGVPPDTGWEGFDGTARPEKYSRPYTADDVRKHTLWGSLLAGGAGVEYYFGYTLPQNDLGAQDWRSRAQSWKWCDLALRFFRENAIPFWNMHNADELVGNPSHDNSRYCFAQPGEIYVVYLPNGGSAELDLGRGADGATFQVRWFNPREGGPLQSGNVSEVRGSGRVSLGEPPADAAADWVVLVARAPRP